MKTQDKEQLKRGDVLKFSEEGLNWLSCGEGSREKMSKFRFEYRCVHSRDNDCLSVIRLGKPYRKYTTYHHSFLEKVDKEMSYKDMALEVIEHLVDDDFMMDADYHVNIKPEEEFTQKDAQLMARKLLRIYRITHSTNPDHTCYATHEDWRKELLDTYQEMVKHE